MAQTVDTRPIEFSFDSQESFKDWLKPPAPEPKDADFEELVRIVDFHYDNEGGQLVGLQKARLDLLKKTDDQALIRKVVAASMYAQDEHLGIGDTLSLF